MSKQSQERSKAAARRLVEEVFNKGDMRTFDELLADEYVNHNMPVPNLPGTKEGFRSLVVATGEAFPDVRVSIEHMVAEDHLVVFHDAARATSRGAFLGVPPTGKRVEWTEIHFLRALEQFSSGPFLPDETRRSRVAIRSTESRARLPRIWDAAPLRRIRLAHLPAS